MSTNKKQRHPEQLPWSNTNTPTKLGIETADISELNKQWRKNNSSRAFSIAAFEAAFDFYEKSMRKWEKEQKKLAKVGYKISMGAISPYKNDAGKTVYYMNVKSDDKSKYPQRKVRDRDEDRFWGYYTLAQLRARPFFVQDHFGDGKWEREIETLKARAKKGAKSTYVFISATQARPKDSACEVRDKQMAVDVVEALSADARLCEAFASFKAEKASIATTGSYMDSGGYAGVHFVIKHKEGVDVLAWLDGVEDAGGSLSNAIVDSLYSAAGDLGSIYNFSAEISSDQKPYKAFSLR